ncbi:hypothetical protein L596_015922 [Steinernema carpocapsae]|uniref:Uncharacterized protein n=1 Tax=Steinernema carpocapsae TaxID=34508 RepID=A0A4U5NH20_STECR|nr:hypothetical protein L596_015922 [Steinernema carpocapsae]
MGPKGKMLLKGLDALMHCQLTNFVEHYNKDMAAQSTKPDSVRLPCEEDPQREQTEPRFLRESSERF